MSNEPTPALAEQLRALADAMKADDAVNAAEIERARREGNRHYEHELIGAKRDTHAWHMKLRAILDNAAPTDRRGVEAGGWRDISTAANDVLVERRRQTEAEGWTKEHDDAHDDGALARAAACYAIYGDEQAMDCVEFFDNLWPWSRKWWKPTDQRRNLVKAGALILAEIERIDRSIKARPLPAPPASGGE